MHNGHASILFVKGNARVEIAYGQRDMSQSKIWHRKSSLCGIWVRINFQLHQYPLAFAVATVGFVPPNRCNERTPTSGPATCERGPAGRNLHRLPVPATIRGHPPTAAAQRRGRLSY